MRSTIYRRNHTSDSESEPLLGALYPAIPGPSVLQNEVFTHYSRKEFFTANTFSWLWNLGHL